MNRLGSLLASLLCVGAVVAAMERPRSDAAVGVAYSAMAKDASKDLQPAPPVRAADPVKSDAPQVVKQESKPLPEVKQEIPVSAEIQSLPVPKPGALKDPRPMTKEQLEWLQLIFDRKLVPESTREQILVDANAISLQGLNRLQADGAIRRCLEVMKNPPPKVRQEEPEQGGCSGGSCGVRTRIFGGGIF